MPRQTKQLSATEVKNAKAKEKEYYLVDGQGLKLRVLPSGSKQWLFNYYRPTNGKRANLNLGRFPDVSLVQALKASLNAKKLIAQGVDPQDERKRQQQIHKEIHEHTCANVAKDWFAIKQHDVTPDYALDIWRSLELHIFPHIANKPIEAKGSLETVKRLAQRLNEIMNFATNCGLIQANPLTGIKAAFKKPQKKKTWRH